MPRRSKSGDPKELHAQLMAILEDFDSELQSGNLRIRVRSLVPAFYALRDLGCSLVSAEDGGGMKRVLKYFLEYPLTILDGDELMVVSGIQEWARRLRELRVQMGYRILSGQAARQMVMEDEDGIPGIDLGSMKNDQYILLDQQPDRDAAYRWHVANTTRRMPGSVKSRILHFFRENVGKPITGEELRYVARGSKEWARRVRELRTEEGRPIVTTKNGRPDLPIGVYVLESDRQAPAHDRIIRDSVRRAVLRRDNYRCVQCGWSNAEWNQDDPRNLEAHHVKRHVDGGGTRKITS